MWAIEVENEIPVGHVRLDWMVRRDIRARKHGEQYWDEAVQDGADDVRVGESEPDVDARFDHAHLVVEWAVRGPVEHQRAAPVNARSGVMCHARGNRQADEQIFDDV